MILASTALNLGVQGAKDLVAVVRALGSSQTMTHVVDVFRGGNRRAVKSQRHDTLSVHGIGKGFRSVRCSQTRHTVVHGQGLQVVEPASEACS